jgi:hypothetical protein
MRVVFFFDLKRIVAVLARNTKANPNHGGIRMSHSNGLGLNAVQTANEERHQQSLDRFFGPETREPKNFQQEVMARPVTRQNAAPPAPRPFARPAVSLPAFDAIEGRIRMVPGMVRHLEGIDLDGDGVADIPLGPPPPHVMMDPMGRMQWQAMAEHRRRAMRHERQQRKERGNEALLRLLAALDPLCGHVRGKVHDFVSALPPKVRRALLRAVEETPGAYLELYGEMRTLLLDPQRKGCPRCTPERKSGTTSVSHGCRPDAPDRDEADWGGGWAPPPEFEAERKALAKRMKAGLANEGDSLRYLELCGL